MKRIVLAVVLNLIFCTTALANQAANRETLYQGSTIEALLAGNYDGVADVKMIKEQGDMGLGTFTGLDGEMIVLDGKVYKAAKDGKVTLEKDNMQTPFYAVTFFDADKTQKLTSQGFSIETLRAELDKLRPRNDLPYAIIIKGSFSMVKVRSVGPYPEPYPLLSEAVADQNVIEHTALPGRLVGFWMPSYMGNANAAGYHLHFLSDDCQKGGHVLALAVNDVEVYLDETPNMHIGFSPYPTRPLPAPDSYKA